MWLPPKPSYNVLSALSLRDREVCTTFRFKSDQLLIVSGRKIICLRDNSAHHSYRKTAGCTFSLKDSTPTRVGVENYLERDLDVFGTFSAIFEWHRISINIFGTHRSIFGNFSVLPGFGKSGKYEEGNYAGIFC